MKTFFSLCLVIASPVLYFVVTPMLNFYQYYPILSYLGMAVGTILLIRLMTNKFTKLRLTAVIFSGLLCVVFLWYTLGYSEYSSAEANIAAGKVVDENLKQITLMSVSGDPVHLGKFIENNQATLIVLNRGAWWPFCRQELGQLKKHTEEFNQQNISILTVLPNLSEAGKMQKAIQAPFKFAADDKGELMDYLGLRHKGGNPEDGSDIPQSASFLFNKTGEVIWSHVAENYRVRPKPEEILNAAKNYFDR